MKVITTLRLPHAKDQFRAYLITCLSKMVTPHSFVLSFHFRSATVDQQIGLQGSFIVSTNYVVKFLVWIY